MWDGVILPVENFPTYGPTQARPDIAAPIDRDETVETNPNSAEGPARTSIDRGRSPVEHPVGEQDSGHRLSSDAYVLTSFEDDRHAVGRPRLRWVGPWLDPIRRHGTDPRCGRNDGRSTAKGASSNGRSVPVTCACTRSAETSDKPIPAPSCPVTWNKPGRR